MKYISKKDIEDIKERYLKKASLIHKHIVMQMVLCWFIKQ